MLTDRATELMTDRGRPVRRRDGGEPAEADTRVAARSRAALREELASMLAREVKDPGAAGAVVTRVEMTERPSQRAVHVGARGGRRRRRADGARRGLGRAIGMLRREVTQRLALRCAPSFASSTTTGMDNMTRVEQLLEEIDAERKPATSRVDARAQRQARHVPGARHAVISRMSKRARVAVDDEGEPRAVHAPEGLLPAVASRGRLHHRRARSRARRTARARCSLWRFASEWTALRNGRGDALLPLLARVGRVARREPTVAREEDVRREARGRPCRSPRGGAARAR